MVWVKPSPFPLSEYASVSPWATAAMADIFAEVLVYQMVCRKCDVVIISWKPEKLLVRNRRKTVCEELPMTMYTGATKVLPAMMIRLHEADFSSRTADVWVWTNLPLTACMLGLGTAFLSSMLA